MPSASSPSAAHCTVVAVVLAALLPGVATPLRAVQTEDRRLRANGQVEYAHEAVAVEQWTEIFTQGRLHSRARVHVFAWDWEHERTSGDGQTRNNAMVAAGGSLVFRSARWQGWSGVVGLYTTQPLHRANTDPVVPRANFGRAGKDTYRTRPDGTEAAIAVLAEAYMEYGRKAAWVRAGRQIIDSILLSSNDSKMIPNTFEAVRGEWRPRAATRLGAGFVRRQKLRDHSTFHSVLAYAKGVANDDSGAHRGLTPRNLRAGGLAAEPHLLLFTCEERLRPNLRLSLEHVEVEGAFRTTVAEACYEVKMPARWTLTPAVRYLRQADRGAGAVGGAALSGAFACDRAFANAAADQQRLASYRDPFSLGGALWAARLQLARGPLQITVGTSAVRDRADIVAPWRGFPSGGYTRLMGQVDWLAGAINHLARVDYDFGRNRVCSHLWVGTAFTRMDFDDRKVQAGTATLTDRGVFTLEASAVLRWLPRTGFKLRTGLADADARPALSPAVNYESYREFRFDVNHLF